MKTAPILPARVDFSGAIPSAPDFGDSYHAPSGAFAQARQVFLGGNGLPERWAGRRRFVVLETGFGLGNNFLATWAAWRDDPARCGRLVFLSIEKHPLTRPDLGRAHAASPEPELARQLLDGWPALTPNLHTLDFEGGRVRLMLAFGDAHEWMPELVASVDAFFLDGFAPAKNPGLWDEAVLRQVGRLAAPGATAATWSVARSVRDGLTAAGFEVEKRPGIGGKWQNTVARFAPRHRPPVPPGRTAIAPDARDVLIIGAGLAGASCARVLTREGLRVTVLEGVRRPRPRPPAIRAACSTARCTPRTARTPDSAGPRRWRPSANSAVSSLPCPGCNGDCCASNGSLRPWHRCSHCWRAAGCPPTMSRP
ncbi:tRNA (5-methylaminomethyl-2-thiouridine)(34)-methyltransferase MnmD [Roseateles chitinivorans]|uniref:tRNA (5-methylaminomethyl-2-thiouridine)(34)-methyltransferase MnmD n=1 Tax=Roseateles chitinivorans TaxID=2917965 RepID=UPI003D677E43